MDPNLRNCWRRSKSTRLRGEGLEQALAGLDARSRRIIEARWLREKDTATLHDLADELGVSAERVRQIEAKAMQKMRLAMARPRNPATQAGFLLPISYKLPEQLPEAIPLFAVS